MGSSLSTQKKIPDKARVLNEICHAEINIISAGIREKGTPPKNEIESLMEKCNINLGEVDGRIVTMLGEKLKIDESRETLLDFYKKKVDYIDQSYAMMRTLRDEIEKIEDENSILKNIYEKNLAQLEEFVNALIFENMMTNNQLEDLSNRVFSMTKKNIRKSFQ